MCCNCSHGPLTVCFHKGPLNLLTSNSSRLYNNIAWLFSFAPPFLNTPRSSWESFFQSMLSGRKERSTFLAISEVQESLPAQFPWVGSSPAVAQTCPVVTTTTLALSLSVLSYPHCHIHGSCVQNFSIIEQLSGSDDDLMIILH